VAAHAWIDESLAHPTQPLPTDTVEELADGLTEPYDRQLRTGLSQNAAATAAIAEFGEPDVVLGAFVRQAPGRRAALVLLGSGPAIGACWATALITGHAWTWPVPAWLRLAFGLTLLAAVTALAFAATARTSYRRPRIPGPGCLVLVLLDASVLTTVAVIAPTLSWPLAVATAASLTRMALTARRLPRLLA